MNQRLGQLDSIRGIAALTVLLQHFLYVFPKFEPDTFNESGMPILNALKYSPLRFFFAGHEAVIIFFILSGFVLSLPFLNNHQQNYKTFVVRRIFRIYVPYIAAIFIAFLFSSLFNTQNIDSLSGFFNRIWSSNFSWSLIINHLAMIGDYDTRAYNPVIWSLTHEMRISLIFPILMILIRKFGYKTNLLIALFTSLVAYALVILISPANQTNILMTLYYTSMFIVGALLAKYKDQLSNLFGKVNKAVFGCLLAFALLFYTYAWSLPNVEIIHKFIINDWMTVIGACLFIVLSQSSQGFSKFLLLKPFTFLGKISYSLYLYHIVVLFTLIFTLHGVIAMPAILVISMAISFVVSAGAYKWIEMPAIKAGKKMTQRYTEPKSQLQRAAM